MAVTIDEVFVRVGAFGLYQWCFLASLGYVQLFLVSFGVFIVSFITAEPDWKCVDGYMNNTVCKFNESIALTSDHYEARCKMPREAWTYEDGFTSVVTEYDLVCDDSIYLSIAQSCFWIGTLIGLFLGGYLSDKYGRKVVWFAGCFASVLPNLVMVFPKVFEVFIVCRIIIGLGFGFTNSTSFPLILEFTTEKYRSLMGLGSFMFFTTGTLLLPLIGYLVRSWRRFLLITAVCGIPSLVFWWLIPESPRWLILHDREKEARTILAKVARMNKTTLPDDELTKPEVSEKRASFRQLFSSWKIAKTTLICWNLWFANALVFYAATYGSVNLGGNRYLNFFLITVVEVPAIFAIIWSVNRFGRKKPIIYGMVIAFISSIISAAIPTNKSSATLGGRITLAIIAKFFISFSFSGVYLWISELFPTLIRSTSMATSSAVGRIGSFCASYIIWLIRIHAALPYSIMGAICIQAAVLGYFLPETKDKPTLETIEDMKNQTEQRIALPVYPNSRVNQISSHGRA